jgi:thymidine phosphorylase
MSKKIAEGTAALVLDVKVGTGAFMKRAEHATELARTMVQLGAREGVRTTALLTDMSTPLGVAVGNAVEVAESVEVLAGGGPADVVELTLALAREMVALAGLHVDPAEVLASGRAMDSWRAMVAAQGGDPDAPLPTPRFREIVVADTAGVVGRLGAGRARREHDVQRAAGILCRAKPGESVRVGQPLFELHTDTPERFPDALADLAGAVTIAPPGTVVPVTPLVMEVIRAV